MEIRMMSMVAVDLEETQTPCGRVAGGALGERGEREEGEAEVAH